MDTTRPAHPIPLFLTALVAFFSALAALGVSNGMAHAHASAPHSHHKTTAASPLLTKKAVAFHDEMRKLWEDHITWTRMAIISLEMGMPDADAAVARLPRNQADIGNAVKPFYGAAAGDKLTQLVAAYDKVHEHILRMSDLLSDGLVKQFPRRFH